VRQSRQPPCAPAHALVKLLGVQALGAVPVCPGASPDDGAGGGDAPGEQLGPHLHQQLFKSSGVAGAGGLQGVARGVGAGSVETWVNGRDWAESSENGITAPALDLQVSSLNPAPRPHPSPSRAAHTQASLKISTKIEQQIVTCGAPRCQPVRTQRRGIEQGLLTIMLRKVRLEILWTAQQWKKWKEMHVYIPDAEKKTTAKQYVLRVGA
jgi:hypothetical protein